MPTKVIEDITKTEQGEILFLSSKPELWLQRPARPPRYTQAGDAIPDPSGRPRYRFVDHQLRVKPGQDMLPDGPPGEDGEPELQDAIAWLRAHPGLNSGEVFAFTEHGAEPAAEESPTLALASITDAAIYGDLERLEQILEDERAGADREVVVKQCEAAILSVTTVLEEQAQADAAAAAQNG